MAAVVLRVDSPGGDALASDLMWREIRELAATKPVVASMADVAASGGYYMAMACSHIVAEPLTITGSIGVITGALSPGAAAAARGQQAGSHTLCSPPHPSALSTAASALPCSLSTKQGSLIWPSSTINWATTRCVRDGAGQGREEADQLYVQRMVGFEASNQQLISQSAFLLSPHAAPHLHHRPSRRSSAGALRWFTCATAALRQPHRHTLTASPASLPTHRAPPPLCRGKYAQLLAETRALSPEEAELFDASAQHAYESFRDKAALSRGMTREAMQEVAQGRVWSGQRASTIGLVDSVGGINRALQLAKLAAGLQADEPVRVQELSRAQVGWGGWVG